MRKHDWLYLIAAVGMIVAVAWQACSAFEAEGHASDARNRTYIEQQIEVEARLAPKTIEEPVVDR